MAKVIVNPKGFKVIKTTMFECLTWGGMAICDHCNQSAREGYFVAVLNHWVCPECYKEWYNSAKVYRSEAMGFGDLRAINFPTYMSLST